MGTRSTTHFIDSTISETPRAIIYRHWDGYPKAAGVDLFKFLNQCKKLKDSRLTDESYLASKFVVYLAEMFATDTKWQDSNGKLHDTSFNQKNPNEKRKPVTVARKNRLDFLSVGVMLQDPTDIEYRYVVDCGKINSVTGLPEVKCFKVNVQDDGTDKTREEVSIPHRSYRQAITAPPANDWTTELTIASETNPNLSYAVQINRSDG